MHAPFFMTSVAISSSSVQKSSRSSKLLSVEHDNMASSTLVQTRDTGSISSQKYL